MKRMIFTALPRKAQSVLVVGLMTAALTLSTLPVSAQRGGNGGGGGGGGGKGGGGDATITNPAFVFEKTEDGNLHLLTHDGDQQLPLTDPPAGDDDRDAIWSPDGSLIAFRRALNSGGTDLMVVTVPTDANGIVNVSQAEESVLVQGTSIERGPMSWSPTNEVVSFNGVDVVAVDLDAASAVERNLIGLPEEFELRLLPVPPEVTGGDKIELGTIEAVDVQPMGQNNTLIIAFVAGWTLYDQNVIQGYGVDVFLIDADVSSGKLVTDEDTIRNLTNPLFLPDSITQTTALYYLDWAPDGRQLAYVEATEMYDVDPRGESAVVVYDLDDDSFTDLIVSDPNDDFYAPNQIISWSPDGLEIATTIGTQLRNNATYDVFRAPAIMPGIGVRDPLVINVTNTLKASKREGGAEWRPTWTR